MKNLLIIVSSISVLYSCSVTKPKDFTYTYDKKSTGLDALIDINGCYMVQRECNSAFFSVFMLYPDGLFVSATGTDLSDVIKCLGNNDKQSVVCKYLSWGLYKLEDNTIKTQTIRQEGVKMCTIFRDYAILPNKTLVNTSDYVYPENTKIGYMRNYPSFSFNDCQVAATFYPLTERRDASHCPYLKSKW